MEPRERTGRTSVLAGLAIVIAAVFILYLVLTLAGVLS